MATKDISDLQVLQAVKQYARGGPPWPYEILAANTGQCEKVCINALYRAESRQLIGYGTSIRIPWITEKGRAMLAEAEGSDA